jgi:hypothetical protein
MGSDRARGSYDPKQQYRSVVMQQGRVTLEDDWNESQQIFGEQIRAEALDWVGPAGTPDDGYKIVLTDTPTQPPYDFFVRSGTMYVGGMRAELLDPVQYSNQPDWQDEGSGDPEWVSLDSLAQAPPTNEYIYLLLREQEVSAVEDPDLKDIALGGPDTAQRTRILQRIARVRSSGSDCVSGLDAAQARWATEGLEFDPGTMRLLSTARLSVGSADQLPASTPCQPQAQGGYVDPDNQLIRVQISGIDPVSGNPKFVWGFDDASFLYRIQVDTSNPQNLILQSAPVDSEHQPARQQAVEVLRTAAELPNGGDVAALSGVVFTLDQNYSPEGQSVALPSGTALPSEYLGAGQSPSGTLFLRVWQQEIVFIPGVPSPLGDTGLAVTIDSFGNQPFHLGDYWIFAARPVTPQMVYPERYWNNLQPPEGPRIWACPLGVIAWSGAIATLVSDCRNPFENLVALTKRQQGCCTYTVRPQDLTSTLTLQKIIDRAAKETMLVTAANPGSSGNNIQVAISNINYTAVPPTFDLTVTETDIYVGETISSLDLDLGDQNSGPNLGLAHVIAGSVNSSLVPLNNQTLVFSGGTATTPARANILDSSNQQIVVTLEARQPGADGNLTTATLSNVAPNASPDSFALTVAWTKTVTGIDMGALQKVIQSSFGYVITASAPERVAAAFPIEGVTTLSGGMDPGENVNQAFAQARVFGSPSTICLRPGSYPLSTPLVLGPEHSNITIESCGGHSTLYVVPGQEAGFLEGMIDVNGANHIALRGLTFAMPQVVVGQIGGNVPGMLSQIFGALGETSLLSLNASVCITVSGAAGLQIQNCSFNYPALQLNEILFAVAVLAGAECSAIKVQGNFFNGPASVNSITSNALNSAISGALAAGYLQADSLQLANVQAGSLDTAGSTGVYVPSSLNDILMTGNTFENLAFPVIISTVMGLGRFETNRVHNCLSGFTIAPLAEVLNAQGHQQLDRANLQEVRDNTLANPSLQRMLSLASVYPRPAIRAPHPVILLNAAHRTDPVVAGANKFARIFTIPPVAPPNRSGPVPTPTAEPGPAPAPAPESAPAPAQEPASAPPMFIRKPPLTTFVIDTLNHVNPAVGEGSTGRFFRFHLNFDIRILNNDVEAVTAEGASLYSLLILGTARKSPHAVGTALGTLILSNNKLHADSSMSAMAVVDFSAVTGNHIYNTHSSSVIKSSGISLFLFSGVPGSNAPSAVTGNVFIGEAILPPRPATLPVWITYNTQI